MSDTLIKIENLYKIFGTHASRYVQPVIDGLSKQDLLDNHGHVLGLADINIDIQEGQIQVIMGLSGSGKSTLIRHINRLIEPTSGKLMVRGEDVLTMDKAQLEHFRRFDASMVFQKFALLPHRTVLANASYGLAIQKVDLSEIEERARYWLKRVGLEGFEDRYPAQLSGGMQQRLGLARALATDAQILLMDEAFSALDPLIRSDMQGILLDLQAELHKTIVFITHDLDEALRIGDDIAILRDGRLIQKGSPQQIVLKPVDDYVADFTKDVNRSRVLTLETLSHDDASEGDCLDLECSTSVEEAMQKLANSEKKSISVIKDKKVLGSVTMSDMVMATSRRSMDESDQVSYR